MTTTNGCIHVMGGWRARAALLLPAAVLLVLLALPVIAASSVSRNLSLSSAGTDFSITRTDFELRKTAVSLKLRLVVVIGLEGAGHHYMIGALEQTFKPPVRINVCSMAKSYIILHALESAPSNYTSAVNKAAADMAALALEERRVPSIGAVATIQGSTKGDRMCMDGVGMLSYPNFSGENKVFQYVDLRQLAENAEREGIDLRVIYLRRSAKDMLFSNVVHRQFEDRGLDLTTSTHQERAASYMRTFFTGAGVMHSMLSEISPSFVVCHDYTKIGDSQQSLKIASFISPTPELAEMYRETLEGTAKPSSGTATNLPHDGLRYLAERLQRKLDVLEAPYCGMGAD